MKKIKFLVVLIALVLCPFQGSFQGSSHNLLLASPKTATTRPPVPQKIRVVYYEFPPDIIQTPQGPQGAAYEIWQRAGKKAGLEIEWVGPIPFLRCLKMLEDGQVDAILRLAKTPEREGKFIFSDKPPFKGETGIIVLKSEPLEKITSEKQIVGKKIGYLRGGTPAPFLEHIRDQIAWESVTDNSIEINMEKLKKHHIWGVYFIFSSTARFYLAEHHELDSIKILSFPGSEKGNHMYAGFSAHANPQLVRKIIRAFDEEIPHYDYEKLMQKYIDKASRGEYSH